MNAPLHPSKTQLSVASYFDEELFQLEKEHIFNNMPQYLGHELSVPEVGDYYALPQENEGRALIRTEQGVELVSNVCRHRQAIMLKGKGKVPAGNIVCPLHRWTYSGQSPNLGELIGAPHFSENPCLHLPKTPLQQWNGLLFEDKGRSVAQDQIGRAHV